ncbi:hypothetical protein ACR0ST_11210 [Aliidiomarina sp. Khilg15.8]
MHKFMHLFYIVIIAVMGILLYTQQPQEFNSTVTADRQSEQPAIDAEPSAEASEPDESSDNTLRELEAEIEHLRTLLTTQEDQAEISRQDERANQQSAASARILDTSDFDDDAVLAQMNAQRDSILKRLEEEERDTEWAYQTETTISDLFYTEADLSNAELMEVECRATVCKVVVFTEDPRLWATPGLLTSAIRDNANLDRAFTGLRTYQDSNTMRLLIDKGQNSTDNDGG